MRYLLLVLLAAGLDCYAAPELKGAPDELRRFLHPSDYIVSISGDAQETAFSDKAIVSLVVTTEEPKLSAAIAANGSLRTQTAAELTAAGIKADNINNSRFSMSPQYGWFGKTPTSFKVVNRMAIAIFDESELKAVANVADESAQMQISDTTFEHTKRDEFRALVKKRALDKILAQKALYEDRLGVTLGPVAVSGFYREAESHGRCPNAGRGNRHGPQSAGQLPVVIAGGGRLLI